MSQTPTTQLNAPLSDRQKKLLFRSWHRGTREADLMVGRFAEHYVPGLDEAGLDIFEEFLDENDPDIFDWITGRTPLPLLPITPLLQEMLNFYNEQ
jgi:antitoxin CptB